MTRTEFEARDTAPVYPTDTTPAGMASWVNRRNAQIMEIVESFFPEEELTYSEAMARYTAMFAAPRLEQ